MKNFAVKAVFTAMRDAWPCSSLYGLSLEASLFFLHGMIGWIMEDNPVQLVGIIAVLRFWCISPSAPYWWHMVSMLFHYLYGWRCYSCTWSYWPVKNNRQQTAHFYYYNKNSNFCCPSIIINFKDGWAEVMDSISGFLRILCKWLLPLILANECWFSLIDTLIDTTKRNKNK